VTAAITIDGLTKHYGEVVFDDIRAEMTAFVTGGPATTDPDRVLTTVVVSDIVGSTAARWSWRASAPGVRMLMVPAGAAVRSSMVP
jgi:hypothetical protein